MIEKLEGEPASISSDDPFTVRLRKDCLLNGDQGFRETMISVNWMIRYIEELEARIAKLEGK